MATFSPHAPASGTRPTTRRAMAAAVFLAVVFTAPAHAAPLSQDQQACAAALDKAYARVAQTVGKLHLSCIANAARGKANPAFLASCMNNDPKGKLGKARDKVRDGFVRSCVEPLGLAGLPPFGATDSDTVNRAGADRTLPFARALLGDPVDGVVVAEAADRATSRCQQGVAKSLAKCLSTMNKVVAACRSKAHKEGAADAAALGACVSGDAKGKIAKSCDLAELLPNGKIKVDGVRKTLAKSCVATGADLELAFPHCASADADTVHACIVPEAACRACEKLAQVGAVADEVDCTLAFGGVADAGCQFERIEQRTFDVANSVEPAESPGTPGVVVTHPDLITQFGGSAFSLNNSRATVWRAAGPPTTPDLVFIVVAGFGGGVNNFKMMAEDMIVRMRDDKGLNLEVWGYHRRTNQLEDRAGSLLAQRIGDPQLALDWYYGAELGLTLDPLLDDAFGRRAFFYNTTDDIPFIANWNELVFSRDLDVVVELARAETPNVFLGGHSAGTGFIARYASTNFNLTGVGDAEPGYSKLKGLVLFEGGGGSTGGDPLTADSLDRIIAKADGGLFGAVRDGAPRCVDGTTPCTIETEATDCSGQTPPKCTLPADAYAAVAGLSPRVTAVAEPGAIQAIEDPDTGQVIVQVDQGAPGNSALEVVPDLELLGFLPDSTAQGLTGQFLDDDGLGAAISPAVATSMGDVGTGALARWIDISEGVPGSAFTDNGAAPTTLDGGVWGLEVEVTRIDRFMDTFIAGGENATDWYFAIAGLTMTGAPGLCDSDTCIAGNVGAACTDDGDCSQSISLDSTALSIGRSRPDISNLTEAGGIDIPVIAIGGSNGLLPLAGRFVPFGDSIGLCTAPSCDGFTTRVVDDSLPNEAFPTFGDVAGGYEVLIVEGYAHNDVVTAEDDGLNPVLPALADFMERNLE